MNARDTAFVFATIDRPQAVQRLIFSIRHRYPDAPIHVADQSVPTNAMQSFYDRYGVDVLWMPHDSGVCVSRNAAVERAQSRYLFLLDDDLFLIPETDLTGPFAILEHDPEVGIVGGRLLDKYGYAPEYSRHWAIFLILDEKNKTLTGVPAYHYMPQVRYVGIHKYFLTDTTMNFSIFRREVFDDPRIRWDTRYTCNGEHEDFYLNFKFVSQYRAAYYPGLVGRHRRPNIPSYEKLRHRSEGWRKFMEKWGVTQYCELDHGTRTIVEPGKVHEQRTWGDYFANTGLTSEREWQSRWHPVSLTDDLQVVLASHYKEDGVPLEIPRARATLYVGRDGKLFAGEEESGAPMSEGDRRKEQLQSLSRVRSRVQTWFRAPVEVSASSEVWVPVHVVNDSSAVVAIGPDGPTPGTFSSRWRKDGELVAVHDDATPCLGDVQVGVHEQLVQVLTPAVPGVYDLEILLVAADAFCLGRPARVRIHVRERQKGVPPVESKLLAESDTRPVESASTSSPSARLRWVKEHVRVAAVDRASTPGSREELLTVGIEANGPAGGAAESELTLTYHWKRAGEYIAWDIARHVVRGVQHGYQLHALPITRPADTSVEVEVAAVVPGAGYVPMFESRGSELPEAERRGARS